MKKILIIIIAAFAYTNVNAQELFVFAEPASNMPANSIGIRVSNALMKDEHTGNTDYYFTPELMAGVSKKIMVHAQAFMSIREGKFTTNGGSLYTKYRFYSVDDVHKHFRAAAFAAGAWSNNPLVYQELNLDGDNSGIQAGVLATQLVNKFAATTGVSYIHQLEKKDKLFLGLPFSNEGIQYNVSMGYLLFPRSYTSYNQTNFNLYCEFLGLKNTDVSRSYLDIAPAVQLIFKSSTRLNLGARYQLAGNAHRMAKQSYFISLEHYFLNALK